MKIIKFARLLTVAVALGAVPAQAQSDSTLDAVVQRLDQLEQQNADLREQVGLLRQELDRFKQVGPGGAASTSDGTPSSAARIEALEDKVDLQAGRLNEQEQVKAQSSQRVPIRLTGTLLFSLFRNSPHGVLAANDYPVAARTDSAPAAWAGTFRRSMIGVEFHTPEALFGGQFHGAISMVLTEAGDADRKSTRLNSSH